MIYLASPYSHPEPEMVQHRFEAITKIAADMTSRGLCVFSPITYGHTLWQFKKDIPTDWRFWIDICFAYLDISQELWVVCLPGWDQSVGVRAEIERATDKGIPVIYFDETGAIIQETL
jgi:hypothetical protein